MKNICLAGDGWGAVSAFKSLKKDFPALFIMTNDTELIDLLRETDSQVLDFDSEKFDLIICAGFQPIIPKSILKKNKIINIHYSLLPKYRGMHSVVWAILNGEKHLGFTIHEMNEYIDDGDIVFQHVYEYKGQTATEIMEYNNSYIESCLSLVIDEYLQKKITPRKQDKSKASWVCKRNMDDCQLFFSWTVDYISNFFKALSPPYPQPFFYFKNEKLIIDTAHLVKCDVEMSNGRVVNIDNEGVWIQVSGGYLVISSIKNVNNESFNINDFKIGTRL